MTDLNIHEVDYVGGSVNQSINEIEISISQNSMSYFKPLLVGFVLVHS